MKTSTKITSVSLLFMTALVAPSLLQAFKPSENSRQYNSKIREAILSKNYTQFQEATTDRPRNINEDRFNKLSERIQNRKEPQESRKQDRKQDKESRKTAIENNDYSAFQKATPNKDISLEDFSEKVVKHKERQVQKTVIKNALENNDYEAWKNAIPSDSQLAEKINSTNFPRFVELKKLTEQAKAIRTELGLEKKSKKHNKKSQCSLMNKESLQSRRNYGRSIRVNN